ncbi:MAG: hypothetical protein CEO22_401 [Candidatus Berkelbacteria bacterium Gr01-1014_85]|uniref:Uncharacterized protein n=1 Tax=Candidatus Berkelbacteria bacterium Gr01-1014_85 TaxID=2017150 RepID=A0A554JBH4_9BACT|nr:MAG: hypothetical protein CEO22_401 [Candidatus Berkelbacteria bacterium Gr01-1014_85]
MHASIQYLPITKDTHDQALIIANILAMNGRSDIGLSDCYIITQAKKFATNLLIATSNHKDFPLFFFDRVGHHVVTDTVHPILICFYRFSAEKYKNQSERFESPLK